MATLLDALYMTLSLDPTDFIKGQRDAESSLKKTKDAAEKGGKEIEKSAKDMTEAFGKATKSLLELTAVFLGGRGLKEFIGDAIEANVALGRLSTSLGLSPQLLSAWGTAARAAGGNAAATGASLQSLRDSLTDLQKQGKALPDELFQLQAKSGVSVDFSHGLDEYITSIATAAQKLAETDPTSANLFLRRIGLDPATAALLIQQGPRMKAFLESQKRFSPNAADVATAGKLTAELGHMGAAFDLLGSKIMTAIGPDLEKLIHWITETVLAMSSFVEHNPGFTEAIVIFLGVLAGASIMKAVANIASLVFGFRSLATVAAELLSGGSLVGLLAVLARFGIVGAGVAAFIETIRPHPAGEGEDEAARNFRRAHPTPGDGNDRGGVVGMRERARRARGGEDRESSQGPITDSSSQILNPRLAASRKNLFDELEKNPQLRRDVIKTASMENNGSPEKMQAVIESMVNRAQMLGYRSLNQAIHSGFYGPVNQGGLRGSLAGKDRADGEKALSSVAAGSNIIGYRTDQGMLSDPGARRYMRQPDHSGWAKIRGENFFYMGDKGKAWAKEQQDSDRAAASHKPETRLWHGNPKISDVTPKSTALNSISNQYRASTTSNSNEMHVGTLNVNAGSATDAHGIARHIDAALSSHMFANAANYGPA